jgi:hypothetical protein
MYAAVASKMESFMILPTLDLSSYDLSSYDRPEAIISATKSKH